MIGQVAIVPSLLSVSLLIFLLLRRARSSFQTWEQERLSLRFGLLISFSANILVAFACLLYAL